VELAPVRLDQGAIGALVTALRALEQVALHVRGP
jgi:hypothetical protein